MYSDRVDNKLGVTIKTCNRLKGIEDNQTNFKSMIEDSGFVAKYKYRKYGYNFVYLLNDYEDIKAMIPPEKQHIRYKVYLLMYKY